MKTEGSISHVRNPVERTRPGTVRRVCPVHAGFTFEETLQPDRGTPWQDPGLGHRLYVSLLRSPMSPTWPRGSAWLRKREPSGPTPVPCPSTPRRLVHLFPAPGPLHMQIWPSHPHSVPMQLCQTEHTAPDPHRCLGAILFTVALRA